MEKKFGEFNTIEELNRAAAAQLKEGDEEALYILAEENGLDKGDVLDYLDGLSDTLATPLMAAMGKLKLEKAELKSEGFFGDCVDMVLNLCMEDEKMCHAVFRTEKKLSQFLGKILKLAFEMKQQIHKNIVNAAGLRPPLYLGIPGKADVIRIAYEYYLGKVIGK